MPIQISKALSSISCTSESFCIAVGDYNGGPGYAVTYNSGSWSGPSEIDSEPENALHSLSCVSSSFCVAVGNFGHEITYNGSAWSVPTRVGILGYIQSLSCHSETFCVAATSEGETATYDGSTWSPSARLSKRAASGALSCTIKSFCLAVGGYASAFNGSTWTSPVPVGSGGLSSVSCPSSSFCTAVDFYGRALTYNESGWSAPSLIAGEGDLTSVSCPSETFCAAVGGYPHGYALTYNGTAWRSPVGVDLEGGLGSVSCVSASFCVAVTGRTAEEHPRGYAYIYDGSKWNPPVQIDPEATLQSVSCASESFCVAVGGHNAMIFNGTSWSAPNQVDAEGDLDSVSCPSASFCEAAATHYYSHLGVLHYAEALTYNNGYWSAPSEIQNGPERFMPDVESVSCTSFSFCMAVASSESETAIFESGVWNLWTPLEVNGDFSSVSCPSGLFCAAVDNNGQAFTYTTPGLVEGPSTKQPTSGDTAQPPVITAARLTNKRFRVGKQTTAASAKHPPFGTSFHFTLSAAAKLQITITRPVPGLRHGRRCLTPTAKLKRERAKRCTRTLSVATLTRFNEPAGADGVPFSGRIGRTVLSPHNYIAAISASDAYGRSRPVPLAFVVVR